MQPHRGQPTRLPRPWDSPGKNSGVGCHFLLQCLEVKSESEVTQSCLTLVTPWTAAYQAPLSMGFSRQEYWSGVPLPSLNMGYNWHLNIHLKQAGGLLSSASFAHTNESHLTVQLIQVQVLHQRAGKLLHQVLPIPTHCDNRRKQ